MPLTKEDLFDAAGKSDLEQVKKALKKVGINARGEFNQTALHMAASQGKIEVVKYLVDAGANINAKDIDGNTALHNAAREDYAEITRYLLEQEAKHDIKNQKGKTPENVAGTERVRKMLQRYAQIPQLIKFAKEYENEEKDGNSSLVNAICECIENELTEDIVNKKSKNHFTKLFDALNKNEELKHQVELTLHRRRTPIALREFSKAASSNRFSSFIPNAGILKQGTEKLISLMDNPENQNIHFTFNEISQLRKGAPGKILAKYEAKVGPLPEAFTLAEARLKNLGAGQAVDMRQENVGVKRKGARK